MWRRRSSIWPGRITPEGDKAKAEDSVLASLEAAPGFKEAQKLLVEIEAGKSGQESNGVTNQPK